jgi:hypothetical protein
MTCVCDDADRQIEQTMTILLSRRKPELPYSGLCYYCGVDVPEPKKFCDGECAEDHAFEMRMKERNGRG